MGEREVVQSGDGAGRLTKEGLVIIRGWDDKLANQLVVNSRQQEILERTPRDATERFLDIETAYQWYRNDQRTIYALARSAELAGVIWFTNKSTEGVSADATFAIRMYDIARGRGFAEEFARRATEDYESHRDYANGIWLETDNNNTAATHLYSKLGFEAVKRQNGRVTMVRKAVLSDK